MIQEVFKLRFLPLCRDPILPFISSRGKSRYLHQFLQYLRLPVGVAFNLLPEISDKGKNITQGLF